MPDPGRRVEAHGQWLADRTVFLDNRAMDGRAGFFVLTPLRLASGAVLLVQRGWAPRHAVDRNQLPPVETPAGVVLVQGRVIPEPSRAFELGAAASGPIRQNLDLVALAADLRAPLLPFTVLQTDADAPADGLLRHWPAPDSGVQKHYGYAFQWFALCALILGLYVWFQILRPRFRRP
jgi:surfeit locus 1 family protein